MARTFIRQVEQIRKSDTYDDTVVPSLANYETNTVTIEDDLNTVRSQLNNLLTEQTANWYDTLVVPSALDTGTARGVNSLNTDLHAVERKRVLVNVSSLTDVAVPAAQNYVVFTAAMLPGAIAPAVNPIAAVGSTTTVGYVAATVTLGSASLAEVAGSSAVSPKNLVEIVDGSTRDQILSSGRVIYALFQTDLADGGTMTGSPGTPSVQLSFVRINATGDDLEAVPAADIQGKTINYTIPYRKALEDLNEQDFLRGAIMDIPASATVTQQVAYDNQGTTPVSLTNDFTLNIGTGLDYVFGDQTTAAMLTLTEGSAGGTSSVTLGAAVDTFSSLAVVNDFAEGVTVDSAGTDIQLGVTAGSINTLGTSDLTVKGAGELYLNDGNQTGSTWAQVGIKLSDTTAEWNQFETNFGEISILGALNAAYAKDRGTKTYANVTSNISSGVDAGGVGGGSNLDAQLPNLTYGTFGTSYDVYLNGNLLQEGAGNDYIAGTSPANGQLKFTFNVRIGDVICVVPYATA